MGRMRKEIKIKEIQEDRKTSHERFSADDVILELKDSSWCGGARL